MSQSRHFESDGKRVYKFSLNQGLVAMAQLLLKDGRMPNEQKDRFE